jgi:asparagine synthase (glutamine-hydrolyzing)
MAALGHRGPDDQGFFASGNVTLGMRRLSIIDLAGGRQPLHNEDGRIAVILNGEIYNFRELRRELESLGHTFRTQSDTEAIAHAYEEWGAECVTRLRGMFALAVAESLAPGAPPSRVLLARDPLGIKPLYYAVRDGVLTFASEVRALLASGCVEPRLSTDAVESYLLFGSVGEPMTLVEGVYSLPPGHRLILNTRGATPNAQPEAHWQPPQPSSTDSPHARERLRALLEESVRLHLIADVPTGVFLSSGVDSTALAGLASRAQPGIHTFTVTSRSRSSAKRKLPGARRGASARRTASFCCPARRCWRGWTAPWPRSTSRRWTASTRILFPGRRARRD